MDETKQPLISFFDFQFKATLKTYSYHILYSGTDLIADIGGYMGLFLGMAIPDVEFSREEYKIRKIFG